MATSGGWQTSVNTAPAPAVAGDFASANPRSVYVAGPGGLVAGASGLTVGRFAWASSQFIDPDNAPTVANNFGLGAPSGFVGRNQQALITTFLADASMVVPAGFQVFLYTDGDFWALNGGTTQALIGQKAYADVTDGHITFAGAGAPTTASITGSIAAQTGTVNGYISGNVLTVTGSGAVTLAIGSLISGTVGGSGVAANTHVVAQLSGSVAGGSGTYALSIGEQTVASAGGTGAFTFAYGILTVTAVASGTIVNDALVSGTGVTAGTQITQQLSGSPTGTGTWAVNVSQTMSSSALNTGNNVETRFFAVSSGLAGELVKISSRAAGAGASY